MNYKDFVFSVNHIFYYQSYSDTGFSVNRIEFIEDIVTEEVKDGYEQATRNVKRNGNNSEGVGLSTRYSYRDSNVSPHRGRTSGDVGISQDRETDNGRSNGKAPTNNVLENEEASSKDDVFFDEEIGPVREKKQHSFAGSRARTANSSLLLKAEHMLDTGVDGETVRQETGWYKGYDGRMRFEIDVKVNRLLIYKNIENIAEKEIFSVEYDNNTENYKDKSEYVLEVLIHKVEWHIMRK